MYETLISQMQINPILFTLLIMWAVAWKGFALWKSAKLDKKAWFIALLVVNTFGILEILYIYVFSKLNNNPKISKSKKVKRK